MGIVFAVGQLLFGLVLLGLGANQMVRGASTLALKLKLTPTVIGLTVVALGTSLPELMVSISAQIQSLEDPSVSAIAWGNVLGSNIFNIGMVLGLCALIKPLSIAGSTARFEYPFMLGSALLLWLLIREQSGITQLDLWEGSFMLVIFALFTAYVIRVARQEVNLAEQKELEENLDDTVCDGPLGKAIFWVVFGTVLLAVGGNQLIEGARDLALGIGISDRVVSTVIVAALTGFPELVTTLVAVYQNRTDMAVANIVGSNIFNTLMVLGAASVTAPIVISPEGLLLDMSFMVGISLLLGPLLLGKKLMRWEGICLLSIYLVYVGVLLQRALS